MLRNRWRTEIATQRLLRDLQVRALGYETVESSPPS